MDRYKHLSRELIKRFVLEECTKEEAQATVAHLLTGCTPCRATTQSTIAELATRGDDVVLNYRQLETVEYSRFIKMFLGREQSRRQEQRDAIDQWQRLRAMNEGQRQLALQDTKLHTWGFSSYLIARAEETNRDNPEEALTILTIASNVVAKLDKEYYPEAIKTDLMAEVLIAKANAFRACDRFQAASMTIESALDYVDGGTNDNAELMAKAERIHASILVDLGRFEEAVAVLEVVKDTYRALDDLHSYGKTLIKQSAALRNYEPRRGYQVATEGLRNIDDTDVYTAACAWASIVDNLNEAGLFHQALQEYRRYRERLYMVTGARFQLRLKWLSARLDGNLWTANNLPDFLEMSTNSYEELFEDFARRKMFQALAISQVEYTMLMDKAGQLPVALPHLLQAIEIFRAQDLRTDLLATLCYLQSVVESSAATSQVLTRVRNLFTRFWNVPIPSELRIIT